MIIRNDTRLDANNLVLTGWFSGLDTTGNLGTPVKIRSAISFGNRFDLVIEEDGGAGALADDNGVDELAIFLDGGVGTPIRTSSRATTRRPRSPCRTPR